MLRGLCLSTELLNLLDNMKKSEQSKIAEALFVPSVYGPSMVEPNQSLSIQEIIRNVSQTGQTGLASGIAAEYDDPDQNNDGGDFDDPTLQQDLDKLDAMNILYKQQSKYDHSVRGVIRRNEQRLQRNRYLKQHSQRKENGKEIPAEPE